MEEGNRADYPRGQNPENQEAYTRSCSKSNPCCTSHIKTSAKVFGGVLMFLYIIAMFLFAKDALYPETAFAEKDCMIRILENGGHGDFGKCTKILEKAMRESPDEKVRDARSYIRMCMIGLTMVSIFMAVSTGVVLCNPSPRACYFSMVGVVVGSVLMTILYLVFAYVIKRFLVMLLPELLLHMPIPCWFVWVVSCYRTFLQRQIPAPNAAPFEPREAPSSRTAKEGRSNNQSYKKPRRIPSEERESQ